jgi:hypothetical protein
MDVRKARGLLALCLSLALVAVVQAQDTRKLSLPPGARIGVVDLMNTDVTHYHAARAATNSFMRTYKVEWQLAMQIEQPLAERIRAAGYLPVPIEASDLLRRNRQDWFVSTTRAPRLAKACAEELGRIAAEQQLAAIVIIAQGTNSSPEAVQGNRLRQIPSYIQGWGFSTVEDMAGDAAKPMIFNLLQLVLVEITPEGARMRHREWGGRFLYEWTTFVPPPDMRSLPDSEVQKLQPLLSDVFSRQVNRLFERIESAPSQAAQ